MRLIIELGQVSPLGDSSGDGEGNLRLQMKNQRMTTTDFDWRINASVASLSFRIETVIQWAKIISNRSSARSRDLNYPSLPVHVAAPLNYPCLSIDTAAWLKDCYQSFFRTTYPLYFNKRSPASCTPNR